MAILLVLLYTLFSASTIAYSAFAPFVPPDNFLIDCGADKSSILNDGRTFKTEDQSKQFLQAKEEIKVSVEKGDVPSPIYLSARIFVTDAIYSFHLTKAGWHWVRLHFYPFKNDQFDLSKATFSVNTNKYVLLHSFNMDNNTNYVLKEYLLNVTDPQFSIKFMPMKNSAAFINAIEVVSAPDDLITDDANNLTPVGKTWTPDGSYLKSKALAKSVTVATTVVKYPDGLTPLIAPQSVYASAVEMAESNVNNPNFNVTWNFEADPAFGYLIRLHFCDIVSKALNDLYFNVYINGLMAIADLDLSHELENQLAAAYYKDIVVNASLMSNGEVSKLVHLNWILFGVDGSKAAGGIGTRKTVAVVGFAMMFGAFAGLGAMVFKWHKRPQDWQKRNSFSSWLLPLHAVSHPEETSSPATSQATDEHSGTAMFAQFTNLSGR
ncbi:putative receptor-like protein kinase [Quercus suber]|uniref:Receptor-like protein kinase n=1 Tax=Quercus suber TaxID=58331 RepID=A0AAW0KE88_QUESU